MPKSAQVPVILPGAVTKTSFERSVDRLVETAVIDEKSDVAIHEVLYEIQAIYRRGFRCFFDVLSRGPRPSEDRYSATCNDKFRRKVGGIDGTPFSELHRNVVQFG